MNDRTTLDSLAQIAALRVLWPLEHNPAYVAIGSELFSTLQKEHPIHGRLNVGSGLDPISRRACSKLPLPAIHAYFCVFLKIAEGPQRSI